MQVMNPTPAAIYTGIGNAIATISRAEGYMSLWRGLSSVVLGAGTRGIWRGAGKPTADDDIQDRRTPCISLRTRWSSRPWAATPQAIILLQLVMPP